MKTKMLGLILCMFMGWNVHAAEGDKLNLTLDKNLLEAGKLQSFVHEYKVKGQGKKKRVVGVLLINASPDTVWQVLVNWDSMGEFIPSLDYYRTIKVLSPLGKGLAGRSLIEGKLSFALFSVQYTLDVIFDEPDKLQQWCMLTDDEVINYNKKSIAVKRSSGGLKNIEGFEYIEPYDNGAKTIYYYAPIVETSVPLPGFVERSISKSTLSDYMEAIKARAEEFAKDAQE